MPRPTMTSRAFNQDTAAAKRAAANGPVVITDRGQPAHVLLSYEAFVALTGEAASIVELLTRTPGAGDIDLDSPRFSGTARAADLSD